jgi:alanyl-tRNA synthetase
MHGFRALRDTVAAGTRLLSTGADDLPAAIERLQTDNKEARRREKLLQERLARHEAAAMAERAARVAGASIVIEALEGWDANGLKTIAAAIAERPGHAAILVGALSERQRVEGPLSLVIARAADVAIDASAIVKALTARFGGKGGGRPEMAQGGGLTASADDVMAMARSLL